MLVLTFCSLCLFTSTREKSLVWIPSVCCGESNFVCSLSGCSFRLSCEMFGKQLFEAGASVSWAPPVWVSTCIVPARSGAHLEMSLALRISSNRSCSSLFFVETDNDTETLGAFVTSVVAEAWAQSLWPSSQPLLSTGMAAAFPNLYFSLCSFASFKNRCIWLG